MLNCLHLLLLWHSSQLIVGCRGRGLFLQSNRAFLRLLRIAVLHLLLCFLCQLLSHVVLVALDFREVQGWHQGARPSILLRSCSLRLPCGDAPDPRLLIVDLELLLDLVQLAFQPADRSVLILKLYFLESQLLLQLSILHGHLLLLLEVFLDLSQLFL